jgi:uncharacterized repeat protein (TIGR03943 family)
MPKARTLYLTPPLLLAGWGGIFLYLAVSGRLRVLLNPLFWPGEEIAAGVLLAMAAGYLFFFRPEEREIDQRAWRRGWWRVGVLLIPLLVAVNFAPASFSARALERRAGLSGGRMLAQAGAGSIKVAPDHVELVDLATAAYYPEHIPEVSGKKVSYLGQYFPGTGGEFRFCRVLMSCCAQDATPLYLHVIGVPPAGLSEMQWITIEGETFFRKDDGEWTPCVRLTGLTKSEAPPDPYLYPVRAKPGP